MSLNRDVKLYVNKNEKNKLKKISKFSIKLTIIKV